MRFSPAKLASAEFVWGVHFVERVISKERLTALSPFVGDLFRLPFLDNSIDLVWTAHALEPNGGREVAALEELFRVSSQSVVSFEPSYEENSLEGRRRIESLGYVRGLSMAITQAGGELMASFPLRNVGNALNPTWAYVCRKAERGTRRIQGLPWACPASRLAMERRGDCFFSVSSRLAYPIIQGIPILRVGQAILASSLG
jgi:uncharacterized protein YbaR (Trm112 family)